MSNLPTFDEVMATYEYEDSMRLPNYQTRELRRYHPYIRLLATPILEGPSSNRYMNTIYDEESVMLEVPPPPPPSHRHAIQALDAPPAPPTPAPAVPELVGDAVPEPNAVQRDQERIERIFRLRGLIMEFLDAARRAMTRDAPATSVGTAALPDERDGNAPAVVGLKDLCVQHTIYDEGFVELNVPLIRQEPQGHVSTTPLTPPATSAPTPAILEPLDDTSPHAMQPNVERGGEYIENTSHMQGATNAIQDMETASDAHLPSASKE